MEGLVPGRIVYYVFDAAAAAQVNRRRTTGVSIAERIAAKEWPCGAQAHIGNPVAIGAVAPAMVLGVHDEHTVNLKVFVDGADEYWAKTVVYDAAGQPGTWHWMFDGQHNRYTPDRIAPLAARE